MFFKKLKKNLKTENKMVINRPLVIFTFSVFKALMGSYISVFCSVCYGCSCEFLTSIGFGEAM